jgi:TrmH family RNA methyltransferase
VWTLLSERLCLLQLIALSDHSIFDNLRVVLVCTRNPLNVGAAARAMSNFGFANLRVVSPYELAFREARSAVGAAPVIENAEEFSGVADAISDCSLVIGTTAAHNRELHQPLISLPDAGSRITEHLRNGKVALLFGSEKRGLSTRDLSYCHWLLRIPSREEHPSMNLGQAVAICLYELSRAPMPASNGKADSASAGDLDLITSTLLEALRISGYLKPRSGADTEDKIRRLVLRLNLSVADAQTWLGMLRQVIWKMKQSE